MKKQKRTNHRLRIKAGRISLWTIGIMMWLLNPFTSVYAENQSTPEDIIKAQTETQEIGTIEQLLEKYSNSDTDQILEGYQPSQMIEDAIRGNVNMSPSKIINAISSYFFKEIIGNLDILIKILVLALLCALLKNLRTSFMNESVGELAFFACYVVMVSLAIVSFNTAMALSIGIIRDMSDFMYATVPVLITLHIAGGNLTSGATFQPMLVMIVQAVAMIFRTVFVPMVFFSTTLSILGNLSQRLQISKLAALLKQIMSWVLGLMLTVFIAFISLQGTLGAVIDGVTGKTAKFAIGLIPVAGKYLADAADTVIACTLLIKNAAGVAVMIGIMAICIVPILKILAVVMLYRIGCVIIEPLADQRMSKTMNDIAGSMSFILGISACIAFMFLLSITAMIGAGNLSTMIR